MIADRYQEVGLRHNPFAFGVTDAATIFVDRGLTAPPASGSRTMVQVIGDKGAGKTTQLHSWRRNHPSCYHYVPEMPYRDRWARPPVDSLVYADEVDRMPAPLRTWWFAQLAKANATVVVGTHVDLSVHARRAGLRSMTHRLGPVDLDTMRAIVQRRLCAASQTGSVAFTLDDAHVVQAHALADGSIRVAEGLLHQTVAALVD